AERNGGAGHPHAQGSMRASPPLREPATRQPRDRRLDPVLQPSAPAPGAGHEDTRRGVCFSGLTCAETAGSLLSNHAPFGRAADRAASTWSTHPSPTTCPGIACPQHRCLLFKSLAAQLNERHGLQPQTAINRPWKVNLVQDMPLTVNLTSPPIAKCSLKPPANILRH